MRYSNILAILSICLFTIGCSKEEEEIPFEPLPPFRALVDLQGWEATGYNASIYQGTITVTGVADDGSKISINLSGDTVGTYNMDNMTLSSCTYKEPGDQGKSYSTADTEDGGGGVTIDKIGSGNQTISGTFAFLAGDIANDDYISVNGGAFSEIPVSSIPVGSTNNTMSMMLSGGSWAPGEVTGYVAFEILTLNGIAADGRSITFELPEEISPKEYDLNYFTKYKCSYTNSAGTRFYATSGKLRITSHNLVTRNIEGSFSIKMEGHQGGGNVNVTEGMFDITYE